jgi:hypothetical protein
MDLMLFRHPKPRRGSGPVPGWTVATNNTVFHPRQYAKVTGFPLDRNHSRSVVFRCQGGERTQTGEKQYAGGHSGEPRRLLWEIHDAAFQIS